MENKNISAEEIYRLKEEIHKQQEHISSLLKMIDRQNSIIDELRNENAKLKMQEHERTASQTEIQHTANADHKEQAMPAQTIKQKEATRIKNKFAYEQSKQMLRYK